MKPDSSGDEYCSFLGAADQDLIDQAFSLAYEDLRRIARSLRHKGQERWINATTLVHEAWLRLKGKDSVSAVSYLHLKAIAAKAMRQILVDRARQRNARKRGGDGNVIFLSIAEWDGAVSDDSELLALDSALEELKAVNPRQAAIVENRFFGGFSVAETAAALGVSESVVERDWRTAKAWLKSRIRKQRRSSLHEQHGMESGSGSLSSGAGPREE